MTEKEEDKPKTEPKNSPGKQKATVTISCITCTYSETITGTKEEIAERIAKHKERCSNPNIAWVFPEEELKKDIDKVFKKKRDREKKEKEEQEKKDKEEASNAQTEDDNKSKVEVSVDTVNIDEFISKLDEEVIGLEDVKEVLYDTFVLYFKNKEFFDRYKEKPGGSTVLYGIPGVGKSLVVKSAAKLFGSNNVMYEKIYASELISGTRSESAKLIRDKFKLWRSYGKPTVIYIDEIDLLMPKRTTHSVLTRETVSTVLQEMDDSPNVYLVGGTNLLDSIDEAFLRSGRVDDVLECLPPNRENRKKLFHKSFKGLDFLGDDVDMEELADITDGFTGADIVANLRKRILKLASKRIDNKDTHIYQEDIIDKLSSIHKPSLSKNIESESQKVLNVLIDNNPEGLYGKEIVEKTGMLKQNVSRACIKLIKEGKIKDKPEGRKKKYFVLEEGRKSDTRKSNIVIFKCDKCGEEFEKEFDDVNKAFDESGIHSSNECNGNVKYLRLKDMKEITLDEREILEDY